MPYTEAIVELLTGGFMLWGTGRIVHLFVSKLGDSKRIHGQFIPEWICGIYVASGLSAIMWLRPTSEGSAPAHLFFASYGLLAGLVSGWIHGNIRVRRARKHTIVAACENLNNSPEDGNPYRPP